MTDLVTFGDGADEVDVCPAMGSHAVSATLRVSISRPEDAVAVFRRQTRPSVAIIFRRAFHNPTGEPLRCAKSNRAPSVERITLASKALMVKVAISQRPMLSLTSLNLT